MENVSTATLIAIAALVILVGAGVYVFVVSPRGKETPLPPLQVPIVIVPEPDLNPARELPNLNPLEAANPFEQTYKNPFE